MADKKKSKAPPVQRGGIMIRLAPWHRGPLEALKKKHRRATTEEVSIALEKHYQAESVAASKGGG